MMDLSTIKSIDRAELSIPHPVTGKETGAYITLASPDNKARKQAVADASRRLREAGEGQDADLLEELTASAVAASVLGWRGVKMHGKELPHSAEAARDLLFRAEMRWLHDWIVSQLGRQANFIETSAPD